MARYSRLETLQAFYTHKIVAVFYHQELDVVVNVARACYRAGIRVFEFTNRGDFAAELYSAFEKEVRANFSDFVTGVGSVSDEPTASQYANVGANFIVAPNFDERTARLCNRRKIPYLPGCGSVTEVVTAEEFGCEIVKLFPGAEVGGASFVRAIRGPRPWTSIMPTGGVDITEESLSAWFSAGVVSVGLGSKLFPKKLIQEHSYDAIEARAQTVVKNVRKVTQLIEG